MTRFPTAEQPDSGVDTGGDEQPQTMSLMAGVAGGDALPDADDFSFVDQPRQGGKLLSSSTLLILLVALLAAGGLYLMRIANADVVDDPTVVEAEAKIEQILAELTGAARIDASNPLSKEQLERTLADPDQFIAILKDDPTQAQVPIDFVQKNPFEIERKVTVETGDGGATSVTRKEQEEAERRYKMLENEFKSFELSSVMAGARPVAVINGDFYREGDRIGENLDFTIVKINKNATVWMKTEQHKFILRIEDVRSDNIDRRRR